ncbi:hypothetical protein ACFL6Y_08570 [Elusimicrobiota bacterium]
MIEIITQNPIPVIIGVIVIGGFVMWKMLKSVVSMIIWTALGIGGFVYFLTTR